MKSRLVMAAIGLAAMAVGFATSAQAVVINVGVQTNTLTGYTRGYWFVAPTNFSIVGLGVVTDASTANFDVQLLRFNATPPNYPSTTTTFSTLFTARDVVGSGLVATSIAVSAGDIMGVLGSRGTGSTNSYQAGPFVSSILGNPVVLTRLGMQADLRTTDASTQGVWTENGNIGRVLIDIQPSTTAIPEPGTLALFGLGLAGLGFIRRRKATA